MSDAGENITPIGSGRKLGDAIREAKNASADRNDVVIELREAARQRLELLATDLAPVFEDVPADEPYFDFAISSGLQPRLWIDAVAHVSMGRDRRTYRFVRETRLGTVVLAESHDIKPVADQVTKYIAERMVERQSLIEGSVETVAVPMSERTTPDTGKTEGSETTGEEQKTNPVREFVSGILLVLLGMLIAAAILAVVYRDRLPALGINF